MIPEYYSGAFDMVENQGSDGLFVKLSKNEESKQCDVTYAHVYETSASKNGVFVSDDIMKKVLIFL